MELYQLNSFVTVARLGNMTRASETLYISLSALSSQIKMLEEELQVQLFYRRPRGLELTPEGKIILEHAARAVDSADEVRRQALHMRGAVVGRLTIGLNTDGVFLRVARLNQEIARVLERVELVFETSQSVKTADMLRSGEIDLGFIYGTLHHEDVICIPIYTTKVQIAVPKTMMRSLDGVTWKELSELPWVWGSSACPFNKELMRRLDRYVPPKNIINVADEFVVKELVKAGQGACVLRTDQVQELVTEGYANTLSDFALEMPVSITMLASRKDEQLINAALSVIRGLFVEAQIKTVA